MNQEEGEQHEVDGTKKADDSTGEAMHTSEFGPHGALRCLLPFANPGSTLA